MVSNEKRVSGKCNHPTMNLQRATVKKKRVYVRQEEEEMIARVIVFTERIRSFQLSLTTRGKYDNDFCNY